MPTPADPIRQCVGVETSGRSQRRPRDLSLAKYARQRPFPSAGECPLAFPLGRSGRPGSPSRHRRADLHVETHPGILLSPWRGTGTAAHGEQIPTDVVDELSRRGHDIELTDPRALGRLSAVVRSHDGFLRAGGTRVAPSATRLAADATAYRRLPFGRQLTQRASRRTPHAATDSLPPTRAPAPRGIAQLTIREARQRTPASHTNRVRRR